MAIGILSTIAGAYLLVCVALALVAIRLMRDSGVSMKRAAHAGLVFAIFNIIAKFFVDQILSTNFWPPPSLGWPAWLLLTGLVAACTFKVVLDLDGAKLFPCVVRFTGGFAIVLAITHTLIGQPYYIPTGSMKPTLGIGDWVLGLHFGYDARTYSKDGLFGLIEPELGSVVFFEQPDALVQEGKVLAPGALHAKRCIGRPGDRISIDQGDVTLNGKLLDEPYCLKYRGAEPIGPATTPEMTVPAGTYFLLGDNRYRSLDSRSYGPIQREIIRARVILRYWPPSRIGMIE